MIAPGRQKEGELQPEKKGEGDVSVIFFVMDYL